MWQVAYVPRPPTLRYPHQSCHVGWGPGRSQPCQVLSKLVMGFWLPEGSKSAIFLCLALWVIQPVSATAQPVMRKPPKHTVIMACIWFRSISVDHTKLYSFTPTKSFQVITDTWKPCWHSSSRHRPWECGKASATGTRRHWCRGVCRTRQRRSTDEWDEPWHKRTQQQQLSTFRCQFKTFLFQQSFKFHIQIQFCWTRSQKAKNQKAKQTMEHCITKQYNTRQDLLGD